MNSFPDTIEKLIEGFSRFPGIGRKTAQRMTFNLLKSSSEVDGIQAEFAEVEKELIEAYGESAVIDLRTGEVKEPEKETSDGKDK